MAEEVKSSEDKAPAPKRMSLNRAPHSNVKVQDSTGKRKMVQVVHKKRLKIDADLVRKEQEEKERLEAEAKAKAEAEAKAREAAEAKAKAEAEAKGRGQGSRSC